MNIESWKKGEKIIFEAKTEARNEHSYIKIEITKVIKEGFFITLASSIIILTTNHSSFSLTQATTSFVQIVSVRLLAKALELGSKTIVHHPGAQKFYQLFKNLKL